MEKAAGVALGLRANVRQFALLVVINGFVGALVGMERSILPQLAAEAFGLASRTAIFSFIVAFGSVKALTNYFAGRWANRVGRKRLLILGWLFGLPVPLLIMWAPSWGWVVAANVLLGINQGLAWSTTVVMKIDLAGERRRGLAMGFNEFAGYVAVALMAFVTGWVAARWGVRPWPFLIGEGLALVGLLLSWWFVEDTRKHAALEATRSTQPRLQHTFLDTTLRHPALAAVTFTGLVNNLNDALAWGLFPILLAQKGLSLAQIGLVAGIYPAVWGIGQLFTGHLADRFCKKDLLTIGMLVQTVALGVFPLATTFWMYASLSALLGWGTAMVYPVMLAAVADFTHPFDRAASIGVFRLWRDLGYAVGALLAGVLADWWTLEVAIWAVAVLTLTAALVIVWRMWCPVRE